VSRRSKTPLAVGGLLAAPLFFASLLAYSLALEDPQTTYTTVAGKHVLVQNPPSGWDEAKIWLLALLPSLAVVLVGYGCCRFRRYGVYLSVAGGLVVTFVSTYGLAAWEKGHVHRFPYGADMLPPTSSSDPFLRAQWEADAVRTIHQLHWAGVALGLGVVGLTLFGELRRRRRRRPLPESEPPPAIAAGSGMGV
jgi:hypothetical protein